MNNLSIPLPTASNLEGIAQPLSQEEQDSMMVTQLLENSGMIKRTL